MSAPQLTRITAQDAESEPETDRTFTPAPARAYPVRAYAISVLSPAGFPITVTLNDIKLDQLDNALAALLERGYMPAEPPSVLASPNAPAPAQKAGPPVCQYHGPMKESTIPGKEGTYFCSKKMADGSYCKERG